MGEVTLQQALRDYETIYMPYRNFAERTRKEYKNDLKDLIAYTERSGIRSVVGIGLPVTHRYIAQLEHKGYSSLTRKRKVVAIRSFLVFLFEDGYIATDLSRRVVVPFTESSTPRALTKAESERLQAVSLCSPRDFAIIQLILQTGIRLSEVVRLTVDDIDVTNGEGWVRVLASRGRKERTIPLNLRARIALRHYLHAVVRGHSGILFRNRYGQPLGKRGVQKILAKYLVRAQIVGASVHTLRHTFGAQLAMQGNSRRSVQEIMGENDRSVGLYFTVLRKERQETGVR